MSTQTAAPLSDQGDLPWNEPVLARDVERETGLEPATFCLGSSPVPTVWHHAWGCERKGVS